MRLLVLSHIADWDFGPQAKAYGHEIVAWVRTTWERGERYSHGSQMLRTIARTIFALPKPIRAIQPKFDTWTWLEKEKIKRMPSSIQAGDYSAALNYLQAVKAINSDDADKVLTKMKATKINDMFAKGGFIRGDGRMVHDMYLMQVKSPDKSTEPWDYYNVVQTFKGEEAWQTKADSKCAAWK